MSEEFKTQAKGGFAPGSYSCICLMCGKEFLGEKRAFVCEPCANKSPADKAVAVFKEGFNKAMNMTPFEAKAVEAMAEVMEPYIDHDKVTKAFPEQCNGKPFDVEAKLVAQAALRAWQGMMWVDVRDALPEKDGQYICHTIAFPDEVFLAEFRDGKWPFDYTETGYHISMGRITHWSTMPIPTPPAQRGGDE